MARRKVTVDDQEVAQTQPETASQEEETVREGLNLSRNGLFSPGDTVEIVADLFPGRVSPRPEGVPGAASKMRVIVTEKSLTIAWPGGFENGEAIVHRYDIALSDASNANYRQGEVVTEGGTTYTFERGNGCSCGAAGLKNWHPFPQVALTQRGATAQPPTGQAVRYSRA